MSFFTVCFCHRANVFCLTPLRCNDSSHANPLSRETVGRDRDGHWPAQTLRAGSSVFDVEGTVLLLAGSGGNGPVPAPARTERKLNLVPARARVGAGTFPSPGLRTSRATIGVDLLVSGSSRCFASIRFRFRCSFADRVAVPTARTAGEVWSRPASEDQFPFPLAPEFWGSWTNS
jgi:hypothetical protein